MSTRHTAITPATAVPQVPDAPVDNGGASVIEGDEVAYSESSARMTERLLAYVLDGVVLFAFTMIFAAASFLNVYLRSDHGAGTAPDSAIWQSAYLLLLTVPSW